jgi:hypothetical protein
MATFILSTHTAVKELYNRSNLYVNFPSQSTVVEDTFETIASSGHLESSWNANVSTYVVQDLVPDKEYKLKFQLFRNTNTAGGTTWTNVLGVNEYMNPASVTGLEDTVMNGDAGGYWWTGSGIDRQLKFKTEKLDSSTVTGQSFGEARQGYTYNTPPSAASYSLFSGPKSFVLESNGKPLGGFAEPTRPAVPHSFDGYLFIFEKSNTLYEDVNKHFTDRLLTPDFVGYDAGDNSKGFLRIPDIHTQAGDANVRNVGFTEAMFTRADKEFYYRSGAGLDRSKEYKAALILVNTTAKYVVRTDLKDNSGGRVLKWFVAAIPVGGVWSITLGSFERVNQTVSDQLSNATSTAVSVDSIGVAGSIHDADQFKIIITAEPA